MRAPAIIAGLRTDVLAPCDVVGGIYGAVAAEVAGYDTGYGHQRYFPGSVQVGEIPRVGAGNVEDAGGTDTGPIEKIDRAADLGRHVNIRFEC